MVRVEEKRVGGIILGVSAQWEDNAGAPTSPHGAFVLIKTDATFSGQMRLPHQELSWEDGLEFSY